MSPDPASPRSAPPPAGGIEIRRATPADLGAVRDLLSLRDERPWDDESTRWFVHGLAEDRCAAWLAADGARPVALTTLLLRTLRGPDGDCRAGYWANLFVDPRYRDRMLYPRLPMAMLRAAPALGLDLIYTSVRRDGLAGAHERLGFARLGALRVLVKPLRPGRLVARYRGLGWAVPLAGPLDRLYRGYLGMRQARAASGGTAGEIEEIGWDDSRVGEVAGLLAGEAPERIRDSWTIESLRYRYRQTREATRFVLLGGSGATGLAAAVVYRVAERLGGIQATVIMDLIGGPGAEAQMAGALLEVERRALGAGCDLLMFLDGLGPRVSALARSAGYRPSPESYEFLLWPASRAAASTSAGHLDGWRFGFGDHDAF